MQEIPLSVFVLNYLTKVGAIIWIEFFILWQANWTINDDANEPLKVLRKHPSQVESKNKLIQVRKNQIQWFLIEKFSYNLRS